MDRIYNLEEVANILQVHVQSVRRYIKSGARRAAKIGKSYRVQEKDLQAFIEARIKTAPEE